MKMQEIGLRGSRVPSPPSPAPDPPMGTVSRRASGEGLQIIGLTHPHLGLAPPLSDRKSWIRHWKVTSIGLTGEN